MAYFNGYGPGTYTVEVFDANNCAAQDLINIEELDEINLSITTSLWNSYEVRCNGDSSGYADLVISGGQAPYLKVVLDSQLDTVLTTYNNNITGLYADTYTFHVWDNNGCPKEEVIIYNEPTLLFIILLQITLLVMVGAMVHWLIQSMVVLVMPQHISMLPRIQVIVHISLHLYLLEHMS